METFEIREAIIAESCNFERLDGVLGSFRKVFSAINRLIFWTPGKIHRWQLLWGRTNLHSGLYSNYNCVSKCYNSRKYFFPMRSQLTQGRRFLSTRRSDLCSHLGAFAQESYALPTKLFAVEKWQLHIKYKAHYLVGHWRKCCKAQLCLCVAKLKWSKTESQRKNLVQTKSKWAFFCSFLYRTLPPGAENYANIRLLVVLFQLLKLLANFSRVLLDRIVDKRQNLHPGHGRN